MKVENTLIIHATMYKIRIYFSFWIQPYLIFVPTAL